MGALRRTLLCLALALGLLAGGAQKPASALSTRDVLVEIVAYYNPTLAQAEPLISCVVAGAAVSSCAQQVLQGELQEQQGELLEDPNIQRMLAVMAAYQAGDYPEMISLAGVGVACAWLNNPPLVCNEFAQVAVEIGAAAIAAHVEIAGEVAELFSDAAATVGCWTGIYCDDDDPPANQYDGAAEWQRCFQGRVEEGLQLRLSGGDRWANLIQRQLTAHRFASDSLLGACYPFVSREVQHNSAFSGVFGDVASATPQLAGGVPFSANWSNANPWTTLPSSTTQSEAQNLFADFVAYASTPLSDKYEQLVEDAAAAALDDAAQDYTNLQTIWTARPDPQARHALVNMLTSPNGPQIAVGVYAAQERASCLQTFVTPQAHMIDRWVDSGARAASARSVRGLNAANWGQRSPETWCNTYYVATFTEVLTTRKTAYDEAIARGCRAAGGRTPNPLTLQCPPLGGGFQRCRAALDNVAQASCTFAPIVIGPVTAQQPPNAAQTPPAATTTAPPEPAPPQVRPTLRPNIRVLTPEPTPPAEEPQQRTPG